MLKTVEKQADVGNQLKAFFDELAKGRSLATVNQIQGGNNGTGKASSFPTEQRKLLKYMRALDCADNEVLLQSLQSL